MMPCLHKQREAFDCASELEHTEEWFLPAAQVELLAVFGSVL